MLSCPGPPRGCRDTSTLTEFGPQASPPVNSCAGGTLVGTANVTGDDTYGFSFNPTQAGQYWWYAYFDGDTNNLPANSGCGAAETSVWAVRAQLQ